MDDRDAGSDIFYPSDVGPPIEDMDINADEIVDELLEEDN